MRWRAALHVSVMLATASAPWSPMFPTRAVAAITANERAGQLDELFATLKAAKSDAEANSVVALIWSIWNQSGRGEIDELMQQALAFMSTGAFGPGLADKRIALVVGNSTYLHTSKLTNPKNDAAEVSAALKLLQFTVLDGRDLDKAGMDRLIKEFARQPTIINARRLFGQLYNSTKPSIREVSRKSEVLDLPRLSSENSEPQKYPPVPSPAILALTVSEKNQTPNLVIRKPL